MNIAIACFLIGAGVCALGSLMDSVSRIPGLLDQLERDRRALDNATPYTGPVFNRHGREIERN